MVDIDLAYPFKSASGHSSSFTSLQPHWPSGLSKMPGAFQPGKLFTCLCPACPPHSLLRKGCTLGVELVHQADYQIVAFQTSSVYQV